MKLLYILILLAISFMIFQACKSQKTQTDGNKAVNTPSDTDNNTRPNPNAELLFLNSKSCRGKCKVYQITVYQSGKADYMGRKNVAKIGEHSLNFTKEELATIEKIFAANDFASLEAEYLSGARDLQGFEIRYKGKNVKFHKMKAPENLKTILEEISGVVNGKVSGN